MATLDDLAAEEASSPSATPNLGEIGEPERPSLWAKLLGPTGPGNLSDYEQGPIGVNPWPHFWRALKGLLSVGDRWPVWVDLSAWALGLVTQRFSPGERETRSSYLEPAEAESPTSPEP